MRRLYAMLIDGQLSFYETEWGGAAPPGLILGSLHGTPVELAFWRQGFLAAWGAR